MNNSIIREVEAADAPRRSSIDMVIADTEKVEQASTRLPVVAVARRLYGCATVFGSMPRVVPQGAMAATA